MPKTPRDANTQKPKKLSRRVLRSLNYEKSRASRVAIRTWRGCAERFYEKNAQKRIKKLLKGNLSKKALLSKIDEIIKEIENTDVPSTDVALVEKDFKPIFDDAKDNAIKNLKEAGYYKEKEAPKKSSGGDGGEKSPPNDSGEEGDDDDGDDSPAESTEEDERFRKFVDGTTYGIKKVSLDKVESMRNKVASLFEEGRSVKKETIDNLISEYLDVPTARASQIATMDTRLLYANITYDQYDAVGVTRFRWISMGDGNVRKAHKHFNNNIYPYNKPPRDPQSGKRELPAIPYGCRCIAEVMPE